MPLTYVASSLTSAGNTNGDNLTLTKPIGTVDSHIVVIAVYFEPDTSVISISPGVWESVEIPNTGEFRLKVFIKRAASEPASYTISNDVAGQQWRTAVGVAYSGGTGTGTLIDVSATAQADSVAIASQTAPSVTTLGTNRLLLFIYANATSTNPLTLTGAVTTLRGAFGGVAIGDAARPTAGATGTSRPASGPGTQNYAAMHVALISDTVAVFLEQLDPLAVLAAM